MESGNPAQGHCRTLLAYFALALLSTFLRGVWSSEIGAQDDEPAHFVTALLAGDFVRSFQFGDPLAYAENYYLHYPKVAIGQWPPLLYGLLGAWILVFGPSAASVAGFGSLLAAGLALLTRAVLRRFMGARISFLAGLIVLATPFVQRFSGMAMTELLVALTSMLALVSWARYLEEARPRDSILFGLFASAALLTKGNAMPLAVVPPLSVWLARRADLLRTRAFWAPALIVLLLTGPWYFLMAGHQAASWIGGSRPHLAYTLRVLGPYAEAHFLELIGLSGTVFALLGLFLRSSKEERPLRITAFSFLLGLWLLLLILPSSPEKRHMILALPLWVVLAFLGARRLGEHWFHQVHWSIVLLGGFLSTGFWVETKDFRGPGAAAREIDARLGQGRARLLVAGDAISEGLVIGALAAADPTRPSRFVLRASRFLIEDDWNGRDYVNHFQTVEALAAGLDRVPVGLLLLDATLAEERTFEHHRLLRRLVEDPRFGWRFVGAFPFERAGELAEEGILAYEREGWQSLPEGTLSLHLSEPGAPAVRVN